MLTRVFLAAGAAALAIAAPAMAGPGGDHHDAGGQHGGDGGGPPRGGGGGGEGHGGGGEAFTGGGGRGRGGAGEAYTSSRGDGGGGRFSVPQERGDFGRQQARGYGRQQASRGYAGQEVRDYGREQARGHGRQPAQLAARQHLHGFAAHQNAGSYAHQNRDFARQQAIVSQGQNRFAAQRQQALANAQSVTRGRTAGAAQIAGGQFGGNAAQVATGELAGHRFPNHAASNAAPYSALSYGNNVQVTPFDQANRFIGAPVAQVAAVAALAPLPPSIQYLYPDTPAYYYRYGDGYLYQVNRTTNLIAALIPLLAGGYLPGEYLPSTYMSDYVPDDYGYGAFYPDYGGLCNRYYRGVVYQVDCDDGYVEKVIPMYAGGYGVGELLPSAYDYYNLPLQYRGLYYDTPDAAYWYSPGAIYQYDPRTSVITSVAALMGPGLAVGQALPVGYTAYNVPYSYRSAYYDSPSAWYRYSNGYIYQVDPATRMITAIVASLLT